MHAVNAEVAAGAGALATVFDAVVAWAAARDESVVCGDELLAAVGGGDVGK